jgi:DNA repair exonuclease SbcCD nuclease subunit
MIYNTGDIHGSDSIKKLNKKNWPEGHGLTKNDYLIINGDFGLIWSNPKSREEEYWIKWLSERNWTTLFIDGNHDNHDLLKELETVEKFGSIVGKVTDSIYHLKRGYVYTIDNRKIFTFGGAESTDKVSKILKGNGKFKIIKRIEGKDWWVGEIPTEEEKNRAIESLRKVDNKVDIILAHTLPEHAIGLYESILRVSTGRIKDPTAAFLEEVCSKVEFSKYYCGHFHDDIEIDKYRVLFDNIIEI